MLEGFGSAVGALIRYWSTMSIHLEGDPYEAFAMLKVAEIQL